MEKFFILFCTITVCTSTFLDVSSSSKPGANNICIYSTDPSKYEPKCFICPLVVYPSALNACVNGTTMPSNITYSSATCIEKNCAINYPKAETTSSSNPVWMGMLAKLLRPARSIRENDIEFSLQNPVVKNEIPNSGWKILENVETYASELGMDVDYPM